MTTEAGTGRGTRQPRLPRSAGRHQRLGGWPGEGAPQGPREGTNPEGTLILDLWPPELGENQLLLVEAPQIAVPGYSNPGNQALASQSRRRKRARRASGQASRLRDEASRAREGNAGPGSQQPVSARPSAWGSRDKRGQQSGTPPAVGAVQLPALPMSMTQDPPEQNRVPALSPWASQGQTSGDSAAWSSQANLHDQAEKRPHSLLTTHRAAVPNSPSPPHGPAELSHSLPVESSLSGESPC